MLGPLSFPFHHIPSFTPRFLSSLTVVLILFAFPTPAAAQVVVEDHLVQYTFGERIVFTATFSTQERIEDVVILFGSENDHHTEPVHATVQGNQARYEYPLQGSSLRPFGRINYRFRVTLQGGSTFTSPVYSFFYEDNRFNWQTLEEGAFRAHWYQGDVATAQAALDVAQEGLGEAQSILPTLPNPQHTIDTYIYANAGDMQAAIGPVGENWVAGHADPDLGVIVVALPPGPEQQLLIEQRIPHELMHILLYEAYGANYSRLPTWLSEGLASITELYPNPDYQVLLNDAFSRNSLIPIASLCGTFPRDASNALLAYAESTSFVRYLHNTYGSTGLGGLVDAYANGLSCERGPQVALMHSLSQLERGWRQAAFSEDPSLVAVGNLLPWFTVMLAALGAPLAIAFLRLFHRPVEEVVG